MGPLERLTLNAIDLSVVTPVYNNAATLDELLDRIIKVVEPITADFEIILVDDGSRDESLSILRRRAAADPRIRPLSLVRNFGSQAAACAGLDHVRGRRMVSIDADLENCPEDIPALLEPLDRGYDLVCGYRETRDAPWLRRKLPSLIMNAYIRYQLGTRVRDLGCGMRAMHSWVIRDLESEGENRRLLTPIILRRVRKVAEVPIRPGIQRTSSAHSFLTLLGMAMDYYLLSARRPFLISGLTSVLVVGVGSTLLLFGPRLAGLVLFASGWLGALMSLLGEYLQRSYQLAQRVPFYKLRQPDEPGNP